MADKYDQQNHISGYLYKKSTNGDWQKRYFEINGSYLTYYKTQKMTKLLAALSIPQVGSIKLLGRSDQGAEFQIDIKYRQYVLRAATYEEAQTWVQVLTKVRDHNVTSNPINSDQRQYEKNRLSSSSTSNPMHVEPSAKVQKSVRLSCMSCFRRTCPCL